MKLWISLTLVLTTALLVPAGGCLRTESQSGPSPVGPIELEVTGPEQAEVGGRVTFRVTVTNRGRAPAAGLLAKVSFDAGLMHEVGTSSIEHDLAELAPGETQHVDVTFRVTRHGRLGVTVAIEKKNVLATSQAVVESVATR